MHKLHGIIRDGDDKDKRTVCRECRHCMWKHYEARCARFRNERWHPVSGTIISAKRCEEVNDGACPGFEPMVPLRRRFSDWVRRALK